MSSLADDVHMRRAIALARDRLGTTWPNPVVGCVIARGGDVVAEAVTGPGGPDSAGRRLHAEEQALIAAGDASAGATAYITLEPCAQRSSGRPSCTERLIAARIGRAVIACPDPSPLASGQGLDRLSAAGVMVETGRLADEAEPLYAGYRRRLETGWPLVQVSDKGYGFDAAFNLDAGEDPTRALSRFGEAGYTRLWVKKGGELATLLHGLGLLD
jgi:diaminohydroxyphosphoribosylaminopyrimidine deaminase/5-amino-6-(5-phosphoribosylamino)uracil reductase